MFNRLKNQFEEACNLFIRPPKHEYELEELGRNPMKIKNTTIIREDLTLSNSEQKTLQCSFFQIKDEIATDPRPCIIYLHCNAGSRCEVVPLLSYLVTIGINVFSFDMAGCGMSEGDYVTLGYKEALDVNIIAAYLLDNKKASSIGVWGRSMGAVTALKYAEIDPNVSVLIVDSPFSNLNKLAFELAKEKTGIPNVLLPMALGLVKKAIKQKVNIKFGALDLTKFVHKIKTPACFLFSYHDEIIKPYHVEKLFELYGCPEKKLLSIKGRHNDARPPNILREVGKFCFDNFLKKDEKFKKRMSQYETFDLYKKYSKSQENPEKAQPFEHFLKDSSHEVSLLKNDSNPNLTTVNTHDWELPQLEDDFPSVLSNVSLLSSNETKFLMNFTTDFNTSMTSKNSKIESEIHKKEEEKYSKTYTKKYTQSPLLGLESKSEGISPIHTSKEKVGIDGKMFNLAEKTFEIKVFMN